MNMFFNFSIAITYLTNQFCWNFAWKIIVDHNGYLNIFRSVSCQGQDPATKFFFNISIEITYQRNRLVQLKKKYIYKKILLGCRHKKENSNWLGIFQRIKTYDKIGCILWVERASLEDAYNWILHSRSL